MDRARLRDLLASLRPLSRNARSIGFSQFGEDRSLAALRPRKAGTYVDVGACHPWHGSNTYRFYLRGWSGVTVEPNPEAAAAFRRVRPRDTHVVAGIAPTPGRLRYRRYAQPTLNTFDDARADEVARMGFRTLDVIEVDCLPLSDVVGRHAGPARIDLLSVDCEGLDLQVLESLDWTRTRPTVVVVEDFEQFRLNRTLGASPIRRLLGGLSYAVAGQNAFSFIYVDTRAFGAPSDGRGFALDETQFAMLADRVLEPAPA